MNSEKVFSEFGEIESVIILKSKDPTKRHGCGFVRFQSVSDASRAIRELNSIRVLDSVCILRLTSPTCTFVGCWSP
jgi:RNA recognition motif-containing protein